LQIVSDNLVHLGLIPPLVHVLVPPSADSMRLVQYYTVSDHYGRHLVEEVLADAARVVKLRSDAYSRGSGGTSAGGTCAFKLAWLRPDQFSRAHCTAGVFTSRAWDPERNQNGVFMYPHRVRCEPRRNIRTWLYAGPNDIEDDKGGLQLGTIDLANALKLKGNDFHLRLSDARHSSMQAALGLPESLAWLWRDYDPDRTEHVF
jgi:enterochelin esterase family protein